jgi:hypothetical protein
MSAVIGAARLADKGVNARERVTAFAHDQRAAVRFRCRETPNIRERLPNDETPDAWRWQISEDLLRTLKKG